MKNPKGLIPLVVVLFIAIIAAGVVGAAWYYGQHKDEVVTNTPAVTSFEECAAATGVVMESYPRQCIYNGQLFTENITNTNTAADTNTNTSTLDTSDWQTYTNDVYGFNFNYLADQELKKFEDIVQVSAVNGGREFKIWYTDKTADQYVEEYNNDEDPNSQVTEPITEVDFKEKTVTKVIVGTSIGLDSIYYFVEHNNKKFVIQFVETYDDHQDILSSFEFLADTTDWQTYTNEELGISFEYPSTGSVSVTELNSTQTKEENRYPTTGKAISMSVTFSDKSKIYVIGSSSDYSRIYSESYNGGEDLSAVCTNPGVIENESYCFNASVADQDTYKKVYFQAPECSPLFVQESKFNLNKNGYAGLRIHQTFFTDGDWDCTSPTEEFNAVTNSEIQRLFSGNELTEEEQKKFENFDRFLSSIELTS